MSLKLSDFDCKYFVKNHFIMNLVLGFLTFLIFFSSISANSDLINFLLTLAFIFYFSFCVYIRVKSKSSILDYARHRYLSCYLSSFCFFLLSLLVALDLGDFYFFGYIFIYFVLFVFIWFYNRIELRSNTYWSLLNEAFFSKDDIELYDFFFLISKHKYKTSNLSVIAAIVISQIAFVFTMNGFLKISPAYESSILPGVFLFISCFIIINMRLHVIFPYYFLKQYEDDESMRNLHN
ncbi:hypothetical protein [Acinetobacter gyllenbergii]|uniref:hypothetical protein n=1 Tax=Acinetobacter gyllenbergii TaxID=134534 RepID=UPI00241F4552|nr:hypothetical protein [Acinetobacter gyllenbergii]